VNIAQKYISLLFLKLVRLGIGRKKMVKTARCMGGIGAFGVLGG
jgi:hypothetical protein